LLSLIWSISGLSDVSAIAMTNVPEFFVTVTPVCWTIAGKSPVADCTAFWTSAVARSRSRERSNVHVIVL
jgi:hypothetical protein